MSSRGTFIGQIIDDLDAISHQVKFRCDLKQFDLNVLLENFFRDILNETLGANLVNLNTARKNEPGLDLGDKTSKRKIAYQITSRADGTKVNETLRKIKPDQLKLYDAFYILVIGERQKGYTIDATLAKKCKGFEESHILGMRELGQLIMNTDIETIRAVQQKLQQERREIRIELQPEIDGKFETNTADLVEGLPRVTRSDATLWVASEQTDDLFDSPEEAAAALNGFIDRLELLPRLSRGLLGWMMDESEHRRGFGDGHEVNADLVRRKYPDTQDLLIDVRLLKGWGFLDHDDDGDGRSPRFSFFFPGADHGYFADAFMNFVKEQNLSVSSLFSTMNFSPFGPPPPAGVPPRVKPAPRKRGQMSGAQRTLRGR